MTKRNKIIYWIATAWLSLGMLSTGIVQLIREKNESDMFHRLGYPTYLMLILGVLKILGVGVILLPRLPLLKEWAYAGFCFAMTGALLSHLVVQDPAKELFGPALLLLLTFVSWYYRPDNRKAETLTFKKRMA